MEESDERGGLRQVGDGTSATLSSDPDSLGADAVEIPPEATLVNANRLRLTAASTRLDAIDACGEWHAHAGSGDEYSDVAFRHWNGESR